jgi:hypothetical protein
MIIEKSDHSSLYMIYIYAYVLYPLLLTVDIMIASPHDIVQGDMARIQFVSSARCSPKLLLGFYGCSSSPNSVFHGVWPIHTVANPIINRPFFFNHDLGGRNKRHPNHPTARGIPNSQTSIGDVWMAISCNLRVCQKWSYKSYWLPNKPG